MSEQCFNAIISRRIRYYLTKYTMTQAELSKRLGVAATSVYNWCNGVKIPRMDKIDAMCDIFHCKRADLMEDRSAAPSPPRSKEETALLEHYNQLNTIGRGKLREYAEDLADNPKYTKSTESKQA